MEKLIDGRFACVRELGAGGMSEVFLARDRELDREVAVKVLARRHCDRRDIRRRFVLEYLACARLNHPGVIKIHTYGQLTGEQPYFVMDYVRGRTVEQVLQAEGRLTPARAGAISVQLADTVDYLHREGVLHRDIKPGNVMLVEEPQRSRALLMDFGLARVQDGTSLTGLGTIVGTLLYLAPEVAQGERATPRSDVFQLGALLYEMLSGQRAYQGDTVAEVLAHIGAGQYRPLREVAPDVPEAWVRLVERCMAVDPEQRPRSAGLLRRELERLLATEERPAATAPRHRHATTRLRVTHQALHGSVLAPAAMVLMLLAFLSTLCLR